MDILIILNISPSRQGIQDRLASDLLLDESRINDDTIGESTSRYRVQGYDESTGNYEGT